VAATASPLISTADLARLHSLEVVARIIVEGLRTGTHRSPHKGHSIEFADHRAYVPGDDLRHLDWKVLGRSDRLVLKRYEAETDLGCTLVVDGSASMGYQGERAPVSKFRYASMIAASVAYLVIDERDRAGLVLFHEQAVSEFRSATQGQLVRICRALEEHTPAQGTDISKGLEHIIAPASQRGLVILLSDCLADPAELERTIDRLAHRGHDLALVWVLDPDEIDLAVATVSKFEGLEGDGELTAEPRALRTAYLEQVQAHRLALQTLCRKRKMAFIEAPTSDPLHVPLNRLLVALHEERR
jgi:uncharacterized protein (DUF58 family)